MRVINLETGMPTADQAVNTLNNRIYAERASGARCVKVVHGYGSTGHGGAIRKAARQKFLDYKGRGIIRNLCYGEKLGPFNDEGRRFAESCPEIRSDIDWGRENPGITIVQFK